MTIKENDANLELVINQKKLILNNSLSVVLIMQKEIPLNEHLPTANVSFQAYEQKFKALADVKRLQILYELCQRGNTCVCDLTDIVEMPQSKLSYHLKILLDAGLITKETKGTWSYYELNPSEIDALLSEQLCCIFRPANKVSECC